ncbi:MAG TPA: hypothetical protein VEN78_31720 [Bradyrhizobium sp.]|nr:hypothetical protein [Bradyrhizobium sp.]
MRQLALHGHCYGESPDCTCDPVLIQRVPRSLQHARAAPRNKRNKEYLMLDVLMLALGFGFFVLAVGYTYACERL